MSQNIYNFFFSLLIKLYLVVSSGFFRNYGHPFKKWCILSILLIILGILRLKILSWKKWNSKTIQEIWNSSVILFHAKKRVFFFVLCFFLLLFYEREGSGKILHNLGISYMYVKNASNFWKSPKVVTFMITWILYLRSHIDHWLGSCLKAYSLMSKRGRSQNF